jgi:cytochrome b involved in lipid metabolism
MKKYVLGITVLLLSLLNVSGVSAATFTSDQLSTHNTRNDCYLAINGKVYDITAYFGYHPGGDQYMLMSCGTDATYAFATKGGNGYDHSQRAYAMLDQFYIGDLAVNAAATPGKTSVTGGAHIGVQTGGMRYPLIIQIFVIWIFLLLLFGILGRKYSAKFHKGKWLRITSLTMLIAFLGVASGGVYMAFFGRIFINGTDVIVFHVYFGFIFVLAAITHIYLHWREIWIYLKRIFGR